MEHPPEAFAPIFGMCFFLVVIFFSLAIVVLAILLWCKIFSKAGYCWALGLLLLVPFGNLILLLILAFGDWPILRELRQLKQPTVHPPAQTSI